MASISSFNGLLFRVVFLLGLAYFCFVDVEKLLQSSYVLVFTQAMNLPGLILSKDSAQLGVFGIIFFMSAIHDLLPLLENNQQYFASVVPLRLLFFFVLTALSYLWESNLYLHNNAVFIYCFIEVWINFVVLGALREERNNEAARLQGFYAKELEDELDEELDDSEPILSSAEQIEQLVEAASADSDN